MRHPSRGKHREGKLKELALHRTREDFLVAQELILLLRGDMGPHSWCGKTPHACRAAKSVCHNC